MRDPDVRRAPPDSTLSVDVVKRLNQFTLQARLEARPGFTMLLGPSGGGKTTLLNCIAGLLRPDSGRVTIGATALFDSASRLDLPVERRRLGYVFQALALFPHMSVEENVRYGIAKVPAAPREQRITSMLKSFRIAHLARHKVTAISGGERQRTALARSLVTDPRALLLDEPLAALDAETKSKIVEDLRAWNAEHAIPILFVTHSPQEAFALGERVAIIEAGKIIEQGPVHQVLTSPRHETIARIVGFENVFDATVIELHENQGTMLCQLGLSECKLEVPLIRAGFGSAVRIAIRAGDIMMASRPPQGLSARNVLPGRIQSIRRRGVTVIVGVDSGVDFEVHVTPSALEDLGLVPGQQTWLVIKTYSCNLVEPRS
jgi:molybdate transport system ATP-binding protein